VSVLSEFLLNERVAVVTGGYSHLGKSISEALAEAGAAVTICGRSRDKYYHVLGKQNKPGISFVEIDISCTSSIKNAFKEVYEKHGSIDILVNNAIYSKGNSPEKMKDKDWNYGVDGVLNSVFRCIREVIPYMKKAKKGNIINISSMYGFVSPDFRIYEGNPDFFNPPHYGAAKAGVIQLTKYYAVYLAKYNIRVNCISPGPFPSQIVQKNRRFIEKLSAKVPMARIGEPNELKGPVIFLASDASSYIAGQNIIVDGGWSIW